MWAMEYNPNMFLSYESGSASKGGAGTSGNDKHLKQFGKFERKNVKMGSNDQQLPLPVFLVASVLETKNKRILKEAKGLDDVVNVSRMYLSFLFPSHCILPFMIELLWIFLFNV